MWIKPNYLIVVSRKQQYLIEILIPAWCFPTKLNASWFIRGCEKVSSVEEALLTQGGPSHVPAAAPGRALIEAADLTFAGLTLRGPSGPCPDHNTISTCEAVTSEGPGVSGEQRASLATLSSSSSSSSSKPHKKTDVNVFSVPDTVLWARVTLFK